MEQKKKTVFQLDSPYTQAEWPEISVQDKDNILELLCSLLSPIGQWRSNNITPSKGKRSKKRKRQEAKLSNALPPQPSSPRPEIASFLEVGVNSITRRMESHSRESRPMAKRKDSTSQDKTSGSGGNTELESDTIPAEKTTEEPLDHKHFAAVFVLQYPQPSILSSHFPQLIATSSLAHPSLPATRLVQLPVGSSGRLCEALGLARVSFVGLLEGAPHSKPLVDLVRRAVPEVEISWLREMKNATYLPVKINAIETSIGVSKEKKLQEKKNKENV